MRKNYVKPSIKLFYGSNKDFCVYYSNIGNFGPGDKDDYDREGDDNWDEDWSWTKKGDN